MTADTSLTDEQLLDAVRAHVAKIGKTPTVQEWRASHRIPSSGVIILRFGSWNAAMLAAGFATSRTRIPMTLRDGTERAASMAAYYESGMTLADVGAIYGLSRERVRQILNVSGHGTRTRKAAGMERSSRRIGRLAESIGPDILAARRAFASYKEIAENTGLSPNSVVRVAREVMTESERTLLDRTRLSGTRTYTDEQLLDAVRAHVAKIGKTPTVQEWRASHRIPSSGVIILRFGSWNAAMLAAGFATNRTRNSYPRRWTLDDCIDAVVRLAREIGHLPTVEEYDRLRNRDADPSSGSIRGRNDGRWSTGIRLAHIRLALDSPD